MTERLTQPPAPKTLVVGLGKTGLSCARYLHAQGVPTAVTDSRAQPPGLDALRESLPELAVFVGGFEREVFEAAEQLVVSPGVALAEPLIAAAIARGVEVVGDIELFARAARAPICAITGSNGKSTVTSLVGLMARLAGRRAAVGGNLGEPALELLDARAELYVLELSSFQLETTHSLGAEVAVVLNLSPDHMDRYPDLAAYAAAKARIYRGARVAVVNRDDPEVMAMVAAEPARALIGFTLGAPGADDYGVRRHRGEDWICRGDTPLLECARLALAGRHNLANALAALALAEACGLPREACCKALTNFPGLAHRCELVRERDGVRWYDDSKGTNPGATVAALDGLVGENDPARVVLIAGGDGKGADFTPLRPAVARTARAVVLLGRDAPLIETVLDGVVPHRHAADMAEAVRLAAELAQPGDRVLLSPACASFDMFEGYAHRGRVFAEAVRGLSQ
ncbi:UDP-N-acetylmuramoyl-L-alanine--D-glutamate ligase [Marichromatium gracile]|uniref:UDP-N-acetylmuramoyl-L-alanine--D-glutamate ligase n=1 Tax=Marichromatium gracile TaxID=1048 RepID=UPI001F30CE10|nr:UDP-N-acetylmuramoyl-L-alanine--D-glutamate ligase [Marichromatium gracile]MCF1182833.1 UDP-N-acetylmuramoyl-L-alanine--D-glutamate ligase [Marichromatium gracile]